MMVKWFKGTASPVYLDALQIRRAVFVHEQKVPADLEIDDLETVSEHLVFYHNDTPIGTGRIYECEKGVFKVQRVAIDKEFRGQGIGAQLLKEIERHIHMEHHGEWMVLDAQLHALPFYQKLGFQSEGPSFMDAGILHKKMTKQILHFS